MRSGTASRCTENGLCGEIEKRLSFDGAVGAVRTRRWSPNDTMIDADEVMDASCVLVVADMLDASDCKTGRLSHC